MSASTPDDGATARVIANAPWHDNESVQRVLALLDTQGEEARVVGGAVRNTLLGLPSGDIDMATTAMPDETMRRANAAGYKTAPTGVAHGTVTVIANGVPIEVTTLRTDVETFGRKANVRFGRDWRADALRRDFTVNALSADRTGRVYDYVGGLADLAARRVRFIGDPAARIAEDYLRILRFFRFHAAYGAGALDADGLRACAAGRDGLAQLSRERVRMEFLKILVAPGAGPALEAMDAAGLLSRVTGGASSHADFMRMVGIESALADAPDAVRRLAALSVTVPDDAQRLWQDLRLSNDEHARLAAMARDWKAISSATSQQDARAFLYLGGETAFSDVVRLAWTRSGADASDMRWRTLALLPRNWSAPAFPIKAAHLIERGVERGPALGSAMREAEHAWIDAGFSDAPDTLKSIADDVALRHVRH